MAEKMWMGTPTRHMQWVPCPLIDSGITRKRFVDRVQFENGGGDVARSYGYQMEYNFSFSGPAHELDGIDAFNKFASGFYGDGLMYVAHPATFKSNMFSAAWASPGLIELGFKNIYGTGNTLPAFGSTGATNYNQPLRTAVFTINTAPNVVTKSFTIPVPPGYTLAYGASGTKTGTGAIAVRFRNADGTLLTSLNSYVTLQTVSGSTRLSAEVTGATGVNGVASAEFFITRTTTAASTLSLTSMMAVMSEPGEVSPITSGAYTSHTPGQGSTGMVFADDAIVETYSYMHPPRKGISTTLVEVEAWRQ